MSHREEERSALMTVEEIASTEANADVLETWDA
jgi:hypothetical protein